MSDLQNAKAMKMFIDNMESLFKYVNSFEGVAYLYEYQDNVLELAGQYQRLVHYLRGISSKINELKDASYPRDYIYQTMQKIEALMGSQRRLVTSIRLELAKANHKDVFFFFFFNSYFIYSFC